MIRSFFLLSLTAVFAAVVSCAPRTAPVGEQPAAAQQKSAERTAAAPTPAAPAPAQAAPATTGGDYQKAVDALIPGLAAEQIPDREQPQRELERLSNEAGRPGAEQQRDALCAAMIRRLGPDTPNAARLWILRKLEIIGTDACVPTLSACLEETDPELRDAARRTLQRFGTPTALNALAAALDRAKDPEWKVALLNALGTFRPAPAVLIARYHLDPDERVVLAVIEALGTCQAMDATMALYYQRKRDDLSPAMRLAVETSLLRLAEEFTLARDEKQANKAYDFLTVHASLNTRMAILKGRVALRPDSMFRDLIKLITSDDAEILRKTAARLLRDLPDERATGAIAERSLKAQGAARVLLLEALADREDPAGAPAAIAALLTDNDDAVRAAALATLARIGDSAAIPLIIDAAADGNQAVRPAARNAIDSVRGANIDDTLLSAIPGARPAAQAEMLRALSARHCDRARDLFFQYAANPDERVAGEAFEAIATHGQAANLPQIAKLLLTCNDAVRAKAEDAVARVALKNLDRAARADPVLAECNTAPAEKLPSLLRVLGRLGGPKAFTATKDAVRRSEPGVVDAAIRVLADWQDAEALPELRALAAAKNGDAAHRVLALRGFIRLVRQTGDRPASDTLTLLDDAMGLADRPDERKLVLAGLGDLADVQALKRAQAKLSDMDLAEEAAAATLSVARKVAPRNRDDALAAIQAVQAASVKEASRTAAAEAIEFINKHAGFIANWEYCGPYFQEGKKSADLYDIAFPPEPNAGPLPEKASGPTPPDWKPLAHSAANDPWIFDFTKIDKGVSRCVYVRTTLRSAQAQPIRLELGSDDGIMAWLNGKLIHTNKAARAVSPGDDKIDADLVAGENTLLLKITQGDGGWGFCCALRGRDGKPLPDFP